MSRGGNDKAFLTEQKDGKDDEYQLYDFLFPGGNLAKLCKYKLKGDEVDMRRVCEVGEKLELQEGFPVVLLSGCGEVDSNKVSGRVELNGRVEPSGRVDPKFMAGIARAAHRTGAVILANGLHTGIEPFVQRRQLKYIGVAPE